jgi:hypothetical protein
MATTAAVIGVLGSLAGSILPSLLGGDDEKKGGGTVVGGGGGGMPGGGMFTNLMQMPMGTPGFGGGYPMGGMMGGGGGGGGGGAAMSGILNAVGPMIGSLMGGGGGAGMLGGLGGLLGGLCWVADELFGVGSPKAQAARAWCHAHPRDAIVQVYAKHGPEWAELVRGNPVAREAFRPTWEAMAQRGMAEGA